MELFVTSRLLEAASVVHGFTTREGGASQGSFASLNLSHAVGDDAAAVQENLARLQRAAGLLRAPATAHQVHGDRILGASGGALHELLAPSEPQPHVSGELAAQGEPADALVALEPEVVVGVRVADCVPVLLFASDVGAAAAVHSGWRGARLGIAARAVRALEQARGADPAQVIAAIGPSICRACYEVSDELARLFRARFGPRVADEPAQRKPHLDLRRCVELSLREAGVPSARIEQIPGCTSCDARFFSHRRDHGRTGRHLAFIAARGH